MHTLSKSDFQLASGCAKKLLYKKKGYPTANDTDEYMEMLAQGGYIIGRMATMRYPTGVEVEGPTKEALDKTANYLQEKNCVLFEAAIQSGQKLIRIDILEKKGNNIHLIEVKAKSLNSEDDPKTTEKELQKYIEDVAYQYLVLQESYPDFKIKCSLLMPDKAKFTTIDGMAGWFSIEPETAPATGELEELPAQQISRFSKPRVLFRYEKDPKRNEYIKLLNDSGILSYYPITTTVVALQPDIKNRADKFIRILNKGIRKQDFQISKNCKGCEFKTFGEKPDGYLECWGAMAYTDPHLFDLYYGGSIKRDKMNYLDELIAEGKSSLFDFDTDVLRNKKGELPKRAQRQYLQINQTQTNTEWLSPELRKEIKQYEYPLHFIDFETYTGALPFHKNMRPYELIAFQWSCHTITKKGAAPIHEEWIHTGNEYPNIEFAKSLMKHIGTEGTPFMWATHENTVLKNILEHVKQMSNKEPRLKKWLTDMTKDKNEERDGRLVDMNAMALDYYFHPYMKGRTSIKKVLPAIWNHHSYLHNVPHFKSYSVKDLEGGIKDPYDTLTASVSSMDDEEVVKGGTAAMRAYHRIRFDVQLTDTQRKELIHQLLQYCKLDTLAMVIIAHHWGLK